MRRAHDAIASMLDETFATPALVRWTQPKRPLLRIVCLAEAGAGAAPFRQWIEAAEPDLEVWACRLPGRENRIGEEPLTDRSLVVRMIVGAIDSLPADGVPVTLFGHCSGALLMYDVAKAFSAAGRAPAALFVGSQGAPKSFHPTQAHALSKEELRQQLRLTSTRNEMVDIDDVFELIEPILRADLIVADEFRAVPNDPIETHISVVGSLTDPYFAPADLAAWAAETTTSFTLRLLPYDHLLQRGWAEVGGIVGRDARTFVQEQGRTNGR